MTKDEIIKLAQEAGFAFGYPFGIKELQAFATLVAAHKTEVALAEAYRCGYKAGMEAGAVVCENLAMQQDRDVRDECAAALRKRSKHD
jgi:hypothetical protein